MKEMFPFKLSFQNISGVLNMYAPKFEEIGIILIGIGIILISGCPPFKKSSSYGF